MRRILELLVGLFPRPFREQFGEGMGEQIRADYEAASTRGWLSALRFSVATAADLVRCGLAERWRPAWRPARQLRVGEGWLLSGWAQDFRYGLRGLRRTPGFTVVAVATLALALGANAGIFSVVDAVLLHPLPYGDADRLVSIAGSAPGSDMPAEFRLAAEFYVEYSEESKLLEDVALYISFTNTLRAGDRVERVPMAVQTPSLFTTLRATPILGRLPVAEDEDRVAVISYALWTTWFGSDPGVIGRTYSIAGADRVVIGVMGPDFRFPRDDVLLWIPFAIHPAGLVPGQFGFPMVGRLAPGVTRAALTTELTRLTRRLPGRFGGSPQYAHLMQQFQPVVRPLREEMLGDVSRALWVLFGSVVIVLLIACANVANLFMVRTERAQRDLAIRRAIGAGRGQLFRSRMAESLLVALGAGVLAVLIARLSVPAILRAAPASIPRLSDVAVSGPTLLFTLVAGLFAALLCGLIPALRAAAPDLDGLRDGSRGSTPRRHWGRDGLVIAQTALALVLLIGSGLLVRSFQALRHVDPGYHTENIFTFQIAPERAALKDGPSFAAFHLAFMDRLAALPGVKSVGIVDNVPLDEHLSGGQFRTAERPTGESGVLLRYTSTAGDYFHTMGIRLLEGRVFTRADQISQHGNVIISRSAANLLWPGQDPIGRRLKREDLDAWQTVVGVVADVMQNDFREKPPAMVYFPLVGTHPDDWVISSPAYVVRTPRAETIAPEIRALVREVAPEAPMYRTYTMAFLAGRSMVQLSFTMLTLGITSLLALILGTIGLYGVLSYVVAERTREIGVRLALGAEAGRVRRMVVGQGARVVLIGVVIGLPIARASTHALGSLLFDIAPADLATFAAVASTMVLVGLLASYLPARRASRVDPMTSLRE